MLIIATVPLLFAILGALLFALADKSPKLAQLGLATFTAAMVALMIGLSSSTLKIG